MTMAKALVTGSFDPVTRGHFSLIQTASRAFDHVTVCIFVNPDKKYRFSVKERIAFIVAGIAELGIDNVTADYSGGYVADYAEEHGIEYVVRGIRTADDMAYELEMANYNHARNPKLETLLWPTTGNVGISSTAVRKSLDDGNIPTDMLLSSTVKLICDSLHGDESED